MMNAVSEHPGSQLFVQINTTQLHNVVAVNNACVDVHICGGCRQPYYDINAFMQHKDSCCERNSGKCSANTGIPLPLSSVSYLTGPISTEVNVPSLSQPFYHEVIGDKNLISSDLVQTQVRTCQKKAEKSVIHSHKASNFQQSDGHRHISVSKQGAKREIHTDEEDVATLLANQLANEVVANGTSNARANSDSTTLLIFRNVENEIITGDKELTNFSLPEEGNNVITHVQELTEVVSPLGSQSVVENSEWNHVNENTALASKFNKEENSKTVLSKTSNGRTKKLCMCTVEGCKFVSPYKKDLIRHSRRHTGERPFTCKYCSRNFSRADKLQTHLRIHTGIKPYQCDECEYSTVDRSSLRKHRRVHTDERPYKCQICPYRSRDSSQLTVHLRTHTGDNPFVCPYEHCPSAFKTSSDLKRHTRMHTGEKPFQCDKCDYKCAIKSNLGVHIKFNHSASQSIKCSVCDHVSSTRKEAKLHEKSHADDHLTCSQCSFTCLSSSGLKIHQKSHLPDSDLSCKLCSFTCRFPSVFKSHMKKKHPEIRPVKKGKHFDKDIAVSSAKTSVAGRATSRSGVYCKPICIKSHQCTYCDAAFVREDSLRSHIRQHQMQESSTISSRSEAEETVSTTSNKEVQQSNEILENSCASTSLEPSTSFVVLNSEQNTANSDQVKVQMPELTSNCRKDVVVDGNEDKSSKDNHLTQLPNQSLLEDSNLLQPHVLLYLPSTTVTAEDSFNNDNLRNAEILASLNQTTPIFVAGRGQYYSLDQSSIMEQLTSLQPGMQLVLSTPLDSILSADPSFVHSSEGVSEIDIGNADSSISSHTISSTQ